MEVETLKGNDEIDNEPVDLSEKVKAYEVKLIKAALVKTGGNQRKAAKLLNIKISTLNTKIKHYEIQIFKHNPPDDRSSEEKKAAA